MKKTFSILFLFIFLASCGKGGSHGNDSSVTSNEVSNQPLISEDEQAATVPNLGLTFDTNATMVGFSREQEDKVERALELIKRIVASEKFRGMVLNKTYLGKKQYVDNDGLSNKAIYNKILVAAEKLGDTSRNNTMDVELELYLDNSSIALGYTYPSVKRIWMNKKYFNNFQPYQVAGNLFHEWLHKLGFNHAVKASDSRTHSIPYAIGYMIRDMAKELD